MTRGVVIALLFTLSGCSRLQDSLLAAPDPDVIDPKSASSAAAAESMRIVKYRGGPAVSSVLCRLPSP